MRTDMFKMRLDSMERKGFEAAARLAGISLSSWARERLRSAAIRELEDRGQPVPFVQHVPLGRTGDGQQ
jgi:hypothetical protein